MKREKDGRIKRLWYLPEKRLKEEPNLADWSDHIKDLRILDRDKLNKIEKWDLVKIYPHIFLCRAPLTFGHSKLVITHPGKIYDNDNEPIPIEKEEYFKWASDIIKRALVVFNKAFKNNKGLKKTLNVFDTLAELTLTEGQYIKTLILKASADEEVKTNNKTQQYN